MPNMLDFNTKATQKVVSLLLNMKLKNLFILQSLLLAACIAWIACPYMFRILYGSLVLVGANSPPFASSFYSIRVTNSLGVPLHVSGQCINDKPFYIPSTKSRHSREKLGFVSVKESIIDPGETTQLDIPSESDPRIGIILLIAKTKRESPPLRQKLAIYRLDWPWENGLPIWTEKNSSTGRPVMSVEIQQEDLIELNIDTLASDAGDPIHELEIPLIHR